MSPSDDLHELGMPFPQFKGPLSSVANVIEDRRCTLCGQQQRHVFGLTPGDWVVDPCGKCGQPVGLLHSWPDEPPEPTTCERCGAINLWPADYPRYWPSDRPQDATAVCYGCLRSGRVAIDHETELGNINFAYAGRELICHGRPEIARREGLRTTVLQTYPDGSHEVGVHLGADLVFEMLRTPRHRALQREYWPYHCRNFMAFLGSWTRADFDQQSPGRGREWFGRHMDPGEAWEDMWEWLPADGNPWYDIGVSYVYQCQTCRLHRVFVDST